MLEAMGNLPTETGSLSAVEFDPPPTAPINLAPREIWKPLDLILFISFVPFALLAAKIVLLVAYSALRPLMGWHTTVDLAQTDTIFLLVQQCVFYVLVLAFFVLMARVQHQQPTWESLGWKRPTRIEVLAYLGGGGLLAIAASFGLWLLPDSQSFPLERLFNSRTATIALGSFAILVAPAVEELVFRGLLFAIIERMVGIKTAVVISAALFASLHIPEYWHAWYHLLMILLVGLAFSIARGSSGSLTPSIFLHIGYNALIMMGVFVSTQHFRTFTDLTMR
jgi:membrane protease YdiL (CAAX protease family)